jgi:streptogrisin C
MNMTMRASVPVFAALAIIGAAVAPTSAAPDGRDLVDDMAVAIQRDLGMSLNQAEKLFAQQHKATELDSALQEKLGARFGGSWFDTGTGKLVVGVTDAALVDEVKAAGADVRVVEHSQSELDGIKTEFDGLAGRPTDRSAKAPNAEQRAAVAGLAGWRVDPRSNSVVVSVLKGQQLGDVFDRVKAHGGAVRVEQVDRAPSTTANYLDGGDQIFTAGLGCSAGFNARTASGQGYLLTAGHCQKLGTGDSVYGQDGNYVGPFVASYFPSWDDALIRNDNPGYWVQGAWVDNNPGNGQVHIVRGWTDSPVGSWICKSGDTTKVTCGQIANKGETVLYAQGAVYNLTRHSACVEPGDSGGANFSGLGNIYGEGLTSGAQLAWDGTRWRCLGALGQPSVSWFMPIGSTLSFYGSAFGVALWTL